MNWEAIGAVGEIVGAAGVIVTLIYLARQVVEASEEAKRNQAEVRRTRYDALNRELSLTAAEWGANPEIADVIFRGLFDLSTLSEVDVVANKRRALLELDAAALGVLDALTEMGPQR